MPQTVPWQSAEPHEIVQQAVTALVQGQLVVFPTDTTYIAAASALCPQAVEQLAGLARGARPLPLAVAAAADLLDWAPGLCQLGRRLARRCWPGPVALQCSEGVSEGPVSRLPESVRRHVCPDATLQIHSPGHEAVLRTLRRLPGPLTFAGLTVADQPAISPEQGAQAVGDTAALVIDDGPTRYGREPTVVRVAGDRWEVISEGVFPTDLLARQTACIIIFVCTGNTCRSPLAEALCKKLLAERLGCLVEELPARGFFVLSAGVSAMMGGGAADEARAVAAEMGADLETHRSRPLTADLAGAADLLVVMTRGHREAVELQLGALGNRLRLLNPSGQDVRDPIGGDLPVYRECARTIARHLEAIVEDLAGQARRDQP